MAKWEEMNSLQLSEDRLFIPVYKAMKLILCEGKWIPIIWRYNVTLMFKVSFPDGIVSVAKLCIWTSDALRQV